MRDGAGVEVSVGLLLRTATAALTAGEGTDVGRLLERASEATAGDATDPVEAASVRALAARGRDLWRAPRVWLNPDPPIGDGLTA